MMDGFGGAAPGMLRPPSPAPQGGGQQGGLRNTGGSGREHGGPGGTGALTVEGVRHFFGRHCAVDGVSLAVQPGELVCLLGPSGCGKTTLLRLAAGLEPLQTGAIAVAGRAVAGPSLSLPPEARNIGLMFQDCALFPHLNVADNVGFGLAALPAGRRKARVRQVLEQVGMAAQAGAWPHQLSGGQQQRVALARALAPEPRVVLLDEPFSGLDARLREEVRGDILRVLKDSGAATLMVTHDPEEAMFMADRIAIMRQGRIEQLGPPAELYDRPATAFVASFLGDTNRFTATVRSGAVATPVGLLPVPGGAEGSRVDVLIRPEGLRLSPVGGLQQAASGIRARVLALRFIGRSTWVHLCAGPDLSHGAARASEAEKSGSGSFHARVPGRCPLVPGDEVAMEVDASQIFLFATDRGVLAV